jgi:Antirestriction protein
LPRERITPCSLSRVALRASGRTAGFALDGSARRDGALAGNPAPIESQEPAMAIHETTSSDTADHGTPVVARRVEDSRRINTLPRHFGNRLLTFEGAVYDLMRRFSADYRGGFWDFVELSNGGFYMMPQHEGTFRFCIDTNGYEGEMSPDAAGITVCLFAYSHLSFRYTEDQVFVDHFHQLREFAMDHAEASAIFAAID